ncbi:MAG: hypothetical protein Q8P90_06205 [bacterium]|nr:hypothetical protein [bacterium]
MKKKISIFMASIFVVSMMVTMLPQSAEAIQAHKWEGPYKGIWDDTYDYCGGDTNQDGNITIRLKKIQKSGKITNASVFFSDDTADRLDATGKIYFKNGKRKIRLKYLQDSGTFVINGRLTAKKGIVGKYDHTTNCSWGGTVNAKKVK